MKKGRLGRKTKQGRQAGRKEERKEEGKEESMKPLALLHHPLF
jgi:hypothetical protein